MSVFINSLIIAVIITIITSIIKKKDDEKMSNFIIKMMSISFIVSYGVMSFMNVNELPEIELNEPDFQQKNLLLNINYDSSLFF